MLPTRADLQRVPTYAPSPLDGVDLDLRDNVNLWGTPAAALAAVQAASLETLREYPGVSAGRLTERLAAQLGISPANIVAGCGSDDVIASWLGALVPAGSRVAHADPSFSMVPVFARLHGLEPVAVPLRPDGAMDIDALIATGAPLIYVCSPNNPTGTVTARAELLRLFDEAPGAVLLDEAYGDFTDAHDLRVEAARREQVLVTRTFSKAWGLAGLRVGYGVGGPALITAVTKARGPYKVNALAERAAAAALAEDGAWVARVSAETVEARTRLSDAFAGLPGLRLWPSEGNFIFLSVERPATELAEAFRVRGIGVRAFSNLRGIGEALRIGLAPWPQLERVAVAAREIFR